MSALYTMTYQGIAGNGHGSIYIGKGQVLGIDVGGSTYHGSFHNDGNVLSGSVELTSSGNGLVTGQMVPKGQKIPITFKLPQNFDNGSFHPVTVGGQNVKVSFNKIGDIT